MLALHFRHRWLIRRARKGLNARPRRNLEPANISAKTRLPLGFFATG
jgi:hypothetical protein